MKKRYLRKSRIIVFPREQESGAKAAEPCLKQEF